MLMARPAVSETIQLEDHHGTYMLPVRINDSITLPFILDTGATEVVIPADVFLTLTRSGTIKSGDLIGSGTYILADGSKQSSDRFVLHELRVGNYVVKDVIANVSPAKGDPLLGQSFLSRIALWTLDNTHHILVLSSNETIRPRPTENEYWLFVQQGWLFLSKKFLTPGGQFVFRRYGFRQDPLTAFPNVMLFFCSPNARSFNNIEIIIPKDYTIKSFDRAHSNPKLPVRILVDDTTTWHFEEDYQNREMFIDRTPDNHSAFDAVMNARELKIGFGTGDMLHYYLTHNMDSFLKEAFTALPLEFANTGASDATFIDTSTAYKLCRDFQSGKLKPH